MLSTGRSKPRSQTKHIMAAPIVMADQGSGTVIRVNTANKYSAGIAEQDTS